MGAIFRANFALISRWFFGKVAVTGWGTGLGEQLLEQCQDTCPGARKFCRINNTLQKLFEAAEKNIIGRAAPALGKSTTKKVAAAKTGQQL
jgi:hypothetical protein